MVTQYGMVDSLGTVNYSNEEGYQKSYSERTGKMIDDEVKSIINEQYLQCKQILEENREKIEQ